LSLRRRQHLFPIALDGQPYRLGSISPEREKVSAANRHESNH
jgi:hypothetical protein